MEANKAKTGARTAFFLPLACVLMVSLKATGHLDWSWWICFLPLFLPFLVNLLVLIYMVIFAAVVFFRKP